MENSLKVLYFEAKKNFGDLLNQDIFLKLAGKNIKSTKAKLCDFVAIGSLLDQFYTSRKHIIKIFLRRLKRPVVVWGTGFIKDRDNKRVLMRKLDVRAVRGYHTLDRLKKEKYVNIIDSPAIGDPGILISKLFPQNVCKKYKLGVVPHYTDFESPYLKNIEVDNSVIIDVGADTMEFIKQIQMCEIIVSSSLHGLVSADSFLIPNIRIKLDDNITGGDYKYHDYYSAFNIENHRCIDLSKEKITSETLNEIVNSYKITKEQVEKIQKDLLNTFPLKP